MLSDEQTITMNLSLKVTKQLAENETDTSFTKQDMLLILKQTLISNSILIKRNVPSNILINFNPTLTVNDGK
jgi:hypothetical protein